MPDGDPAQPIQLTAQERSQLVVGVFEQADRFAGKASEKGQTLVPLRMYFKEGKAKVELAVAKGKQTHDKRESLKKSDAKRQIDRALAARRRK